ncbi:hypothetical protein ACWG0P_05730 [Amedibacillus sp. YH-ame6]
MEHSDWVDKYLRTNYVGCVVGDYDHGCRLYFKDINNFIQNVGLYGNVEILRVEDTDILLNTRGTFIDRIWPDMSFDMRSSTEMINNINYIAGKFQEMREKDGDFPEPLPKVTKFMKEVFGQEIVEQNRQLHEGCEEEIIEDQAMEMMQ